MRDVLSELQLIDLDRLCPHERHESGRLCSTCRSIREEGVLRHPILAAAMSKGRYVVLDGHHRLQALRRIGCRRAAVQVVSPDFFRIAAWDHEVRETVWTDHLGQDERLRWSTEQRDGEIPVAALTTADGSSRYAYPHTPGDWRQRLESWHRMVASYPDECEVHRREQGAGALPRPGFVRLSYPTPSLREVFRVVERGSVLPAGVTRVMVEGRLLNLRIPLSMMSSPKVETSEWSRFIQMWRGKLRLYSECVYLCEA